jgi:Tol biopolymer transport system component
MKRRNAALGATIAFLVASTSLTVLQGAASAAFPGTNGAIAYTCSGQICVGGIDGTGQRPLTTGPLASDNPAWSASGAKIAFERRQSTTSSNTDLFMMNANGTGLTQLTDTPDISESTPAWSPDGGKLVFTRDDGLEKNLYTLTIASLALQKIPGTIHGSSPSWSPDNTQIAFSSFALNHEVCPDPDEACVKVAEIFVVPAAGGTPQNLTENNQSNDLAPSWSHDGDQIVFERRSDPADTTGRILVMEAGGEHDFEPAGDGNQPAFAPQGDRVVFDLQGSIHTALIPPPERTPVISPLGGLRPDWQPCPAGTCPSTGATEQTQSTTTVTAKRTKTKIKAGGTLTPPHPGSTMTVTLLKKKNGSFSPVKTTSPVIADDGKFATSFKRPGKGQCQVTARFPGDDDHTASEASKTLKC